MYQFMFKNQAGDTATVIAITLDHAVALLERNGVFFGVRDCFGQCDIDSYLISIRVKEPFKTYTRNNYF